MKKYLNNIINVTLITIFLISSPNYSFVYASGLSLPVLPKPGDMIGLSQDFIPAMLKGMVINPENPLQFDFLIDAGDSSFTAIDKAAEYKKLVKYFLAALTVPNHEQWVNLSPYEKDRIVGDTFGQTEMGRDLLAQDYLLKQIASSIIYPESGLGKTFWNKVYTKAQKQFGNVQVPINTINKVWIVPSQAIVYETQGAAYVDSSHLKVILEEDYHALRKSGLAPIMNRRDEKSELNQENRALDNVSGVSRQMLREIILPELEKEVNEGKNFAPLRQVFSGMILATWYKKSLKESLLGKFYMNKGKVLGVNQVDIQTNQRIYQQYLTAFKKGVFNYIKDANLPDGTSVPRKYFAGGINNNFASVSQFKTISDAAMATRFNKEGDIASIRLGVIDNKVKSKRILYLASLLGLPLTTNLSDYDVSRIDKTYIKNNVTFTIESVSGGSLVLQKINHGKIKSKVHIPLMLRENPLTLRQKEQIKTLIEKGTQVNFSESERGFLLSAIPSDDAAMSGKIFYSEQELMEMPIKDLESFVSKFTDNRVLTPIEVSVLQSVSKSLIKRFLKVKEIINMSLREKPYLAVLWKEQYQELRGLQDMIAKISFTNVVDMAEEEMHFIEAMINVLNSVSRPEPTSDRGWKIQRKELWDNGTDFYYYKPWFDREYNDLLTQNRNEFPFEIYEFWNDMASMIAKDTSIFPMKRPPLFDAAMTQLLEDDKNSFKQRVKVQDAHNPDLWIIANLRIIDLHVGFMDDAYSVFDPKRLIANSFLMGQQSLKETVSKLNISTADEYVTMRTHLVSAWLGAKYQLTNEQQQGLQSYLAFPFNQSLMSFIHLIGESSDKSDLLLSEADQMIKSDMAMRHQSKVVTKNFIYYTHEHWLNLIQREIESSDQFERFPRVAAIIAKANETKVEENTLIEMQRHYWRAQAEYWIKMGNSGMARGRINLLAQAGPSSQLINAVDSFDAMFSHEKKKNNLAPVQPTIKRNIPLIIKGTVSHVVDPVKNAYLTFNLEKDDPKIMQAIDKANLMYDKHKNEKGMEAYRTRIDEATKIILDYLKDKASLANTGGIDMNANNMDMLIKRDAHEVMSVGNFDIALFANVDGLEPHIISITPALTRPVFQTPVAK